MAAGVGKTYRMLQEGRAELEAGRDVVLGYLEPHGRAETEAQAEGLPVVPARPLLHSGVAVREMDLPAVLERAPELALVDELAHTNPPGAEHAKRYEDIEQILAGGIDVFSTVNVQHLESLNDQVASLTGVRVRETFPDRILTEADEVVLVDLPPRALLSRLRAGKIYGNDRASAALNGFFKVENLEALREVSLRYVADEVGQRRQVREPQPVRPGGEGERARLVAETAPQAIAERLLALASPRPSSQRVVRRAWRSGQRLGATLDIVCVLAPGGPRDGDEADHVDALRRLGTLLGADVIVEEGDDFVEVVARVAHERGSTYVLMGAPRRRRGLARLSEPLPDRLLRALPGVDLRIVADRANLEWGPR
jgi:two-component system sensor histidine kinase KdpD